MKAGYTEILARIKRVVRRYRPAARGELDGLEARISQRIDAVLGKIDVDPQLVLEWLSYRQTAEYERPFKDSQPLVTVCISTYNRSKLLVERCLPSVLGQSYNNIEVIVVGDHCTDDTSTTISKIKDPRLRFENLPSQGCYPQHPHFRWMAMGHLARNRALEMAEGLWITHLDDDDEYVPTRIEELLTFAKQVCADVIYHPYFYEQKPNDWIVMSANSFQCGNITTGSTFYHHWLKRIRWDEYAWTAHEPGDWNRFRKFAYLKPNTQRFDAPLLKHYLEGSLRSLT